MIDDIVWLDSIVDKLAWKHNVMTSEVEDALVGRCRIFKKKQGKSKANIYTTHWGKQSMGVICRYFEIE